MIKYLNKLIEHIYAIVILEFSKTWKYTLAVLESLILISAVLIQPESVMLKVLQYNMYLFGFLFYSFTGLVIQIPCLIIPFLILSPLINKIYPRYVRAEHNLVSCQA